MNRKVVDIFMKPMVTDADNKSLKYFAILNEYYEQKQKSSEGYSLDSKGPLIYLKTLSHELDQATTPKIERVLSQLIWTILIGNYSVSWCNISY